jgi:hypothetical protein
MEVKKQPGRRNKSRACETQHSINTVAVESADNYRIATYDILGQAGIDVCLVNARHVKEGQASSLSGKAGILPAREAFCFGRHGPGWKPGLRNSHGWLFYSATSRRKGG